MASTDNETTTNETSASPRKPEELPFVAPCNTLDATAAVRWIKLGWQDMKAAPKQSLSYGVIMFLISATVSYVAFTFGGLYTLLGMLSGFIFIGPIIAIGLYSISRQLQLGMNPKLGYCLREGRRHMGNELIFAAILFVVLLVWARAATMTHIFFPQSVDSGWQNLAIFLGIGTIIGSIFAGIIFTASAFSLPMITDRKADMVTAVITSVNAVLRNKLPMLVWVAIIVVFIGLSFLTALLGIIFFFPLLGHATWHAYKETINAEEWPQHETLC
jgi:uncharacterized membrane protein